MDFWQKRVRLSDLLEGGLTVLQESTLTVLLISPKIGKKPININNFSGLSREWLGVKFVYVLPFPGEKGKHINKIPRKSQENSGTVPEQSWDNPGKIP